MDFANEAEVCGSVVGPGEGVAAVAGKTIVVVVAILVGIAGDRGVDRASAAGSDDARDFPLVEDVAEERLSAMKGARLDRESSDEPTALVGDAGPTFGVGLVGILHGGGFAGDERVLAVVDRAGVSEGEAQISAASHAAVDGDSRAVIHAGGRALKFVDRAELRDGPAQGIDAGWERAGLRLRELPGREGIDGVVSVFEDGTGGIKDGISQCNRLRKIDVEGADKVLAVNIKIGDSDCGFAGDLALESKAGLLHARRDEIRRESRDIVSDALRKSGWKITGRGRERAGEQRVRIDRKGRVVGEVRVVEKDLGVSDAIFRRDGGVVDLRNPDVKDSVAGANDEWMSLAEGIGESGARPEVAGIVGNL